MTAGMERIGVVGAGQIGIGLVADLVLHGLSVVAVDRAPAALDHARSAVIRCVRSAPLLAPALTRLDGDAVRKRVTFTTRLEDLATCDFIVENVTEEWEAKRDVYERLDRLVPPHVCFGANTSCIPITRLAGATSRPAQVVGVHFMNPVHLMRTVEVIRGTHTDDSTMSRIHVLLDALEKRAIVVRDSPGFVSNRVSHLFMNEAAFVLQDGVASAVCIDAMFRQCFGHKMGPLETADLIGLDTVVRSLDVLYDSFHDPKYRCCPLLRQLVDAGHLGRKTGRGFHTYSVAER